MRRPSLSLSLRSVALAGALVFSFCAQALAQANTAPTQQGATGKKDPGTLKVLNLADYGRWNRITSTALSPDGKWMTYAYSPNEGDATLYVKLLDGDKSFTIPIGAAAGGGRGGGGGGFGGGGDGGPTFSDDSRFVAYYVNPPGREGRGRGGRPGNPGGPGARGGTPTPAAAARKLELLELSTGNKFDVPNAASFKFSKGSKWLAVRTNKVANDTTHDGADLVLRELSSGANRNIGNVNLYDFDDAGQLLAYTVDATDRLGNGVYLVELANGQTRTLDGAALESDQLQWSNEGANLAVLRGEKNKENKQRDNAVLAWLDVGTPKAKTLTYDPAADASFP